MYCTHVRHSVFLFIFSMLTINAFKSYVSTKLTEYTLWKWNFPMTQSFCLSVGWLVGRSVFHNFLKGWIVSLPCFYRITCFIITAKELMNELHIKFIKRIFILIRISYSCYKFKYNYTTDLSCISSAIWVMPPATDVGDTCSPTSFVVPLFHH